MDWKLVGRAVFWGLVGGLTAIQTAGGLPKDWSGYAGLALAVLWAGYGKGSTNTRLIAPTRDVWTPEQRTAAQFPDRVMTPFSKYAKEPPKD